MSEIDPRELLDSMRNVLTTHAGAHARIPGDEGQALDRGLWAKMAELGWLGLAIEEDQGGLGLGVEHLAVLYEELGRVLACTPATTTLIAADAIGRHGSAELKVRILPSVIAGETMLSLALPSRDAPTIKCGRISGVIEHAPFAADADLLVFPAKQDGRDKLVVLATNAKGVRTENRAAIDLTRRMGRVLLDGAEVTDEDLLSLEAGDWERLRNHCALAIACDAIGGAQALFEKTIDYLGVREQFGRPIGSFQALKHRAAGWKVELEAAAALVRQAGIALSAGAEDVSALISGAKFYACDLYAAVSGDAVQLHGGIGFTWEHSCHLYLKRAKLNQYMFGSSTEHKERVARFAFATERAASTAKPHAA